MFIRQIKPRTSWMHSSSHINSAKNILSFPSRKLWTDICHPILGPAMKTQSLRYKPSFRNQISGDGTNKANYIQNSFEKCFVSNQLELLQKLHVNLLVQRRRYSNLAPSDTLLEEDWLRIYQQPAKDMRFLRLISRFKLLQLVIMTLTCPYAYSLLLEGHMTGSDLLPILASTGLLTVAICIASAFSMKLVGQLAYNKEHDLIRISRLTFLTAGKRHDYIPANRIIPYLDHASQTDLAYRVQRLYIACGDKPPRMYYYTLSRGRVIEKEIFKELLGIPDS